MITSKRPVWMERPSKTMLTAKIIVLSMTVVGVVYPFLNVISSSLSTEEDLSANGGLVPLPLHANLNAYLTVMRGAIVPRALLVSVGTTFVGTLVTMVITTSLAYALSRPIVGRRFLLFAVLFSFLLPPGLIPLYLVVRALGLLNNFASLILPAALNIFGVIVIRQFFMIGIPQELIDSARMDGASELGIFLRITLPLSKAVLAVIALFSAVGFWNDFFRALLYLNDSRMWPLSMILRFYSTSANTAAGGAAGGAEVIAPPQAISTAVVVIAMLPILMVYPFLQKYFSRGVLLGAIKG